MDSQNKNVKIEELINDESKVEETLKNIKSDNVFPVVPIIVSNNYIKKYYLDKRLEMLPREVKDTLKILFVKLTTETGGIAEVLYDNNDYSVSLKISCNDNDYNFDEINANYKLAKIERENEQLFNDIANFCKFKFNDLV